MSWGSICFVVSAVVFLLLGYGVIADTGKVHLILIAAGLVPLGLVLSGIPIPITFTRKE